MRVRRMGMSGELNGDKVIELLRKWAGGNDHELSALGQQVYLKAARIIEGQAANIVTEMRERGRLEAQIESLAAQLEQERGKVAELIDRLRVEQRQFQSIRGYTKDGELACICANHESAIKELLATHTDNGGSNG